MNKSMMPIRSDLNGQSGSAIFNLAVTVNERKMPSNKP